MKRVRRFFIGVAALVVIGSALYLYLNWPESAANGEADAPGRVMALLAGALLVIILLLLAGRLAAGGPPADDGPAGRMDKTQGALNDAEEFLDRSSARARLSIDIEDARDD